MQAAADAEGEPVWPLPLPAEMRAELDSDVADIKNISGKRWGGASIAGVFLQEFVGDGIPWAHLDIAGPGRLRRGRRPDPQGRHRLRRPHPAPPAVVFRKPAKASAYRRGRSVAGVAAAEAGEAHGQQRGGDREQRGRRPE